MAVWVAGGGVAWRGVLPCLACVLWHHRMMINRCPLVVVVQVLREADAPVLHRRRPQVPLEEHGAQVKELVLSAGGGLIPHL